MSRIAAEVLQTSQKLQQEHVKTMQNIEEMIQSFPQLHKSGSNEDSETDSQLSEGLEFLDSTRQYNDAEILDFLQSTTRDMFDMPEAEEAQHSVDYDEAQEESFPDEEELETSEDGDGSAALKNDANDHDKQYEITDELIQIDTAGAKQEELDEEFEQILADELIETSSESKKKDMVIDEMRTELETLKEQFQTVRASPRQILLEDSKVMQLEAQVKEQKKELKHLKQLCNEKDKHFADTFAMAQERFKEMQVQRSGTEYVDLKAELLNARQQLQQTQQELVESLGKCELLEKQLSGARSEIEDFNRERQFLVSKEMYQEALDGISASRREAQAAVEQQGALKAEIGDLEAAKQELQRELARVQAQIVEREDECEQLQSELIAAQEEKEEMQLQKAEVQLQLTSSQRQRSQELEFERLTPIDVKQEEIDRLNRLVADLRQQLENQQSEDANEQICVLQAKTSQLERFIDELQRVNEELQVECSDGAVECQTVESEKEAINAEFIQKCADFNALSDEHDEMIAKYEHIAEDAADLQNALSEARMQAEKYKEDKERAEKALKIQMQEFQQEMKLLEGLK